MAHPETERVVQRASEQFEQTVSQLGDYLTLPAISCDPRHHDDVRALARRVRDDLAQLGLARARVVELGGALPLVAAERLDAGEGRPTLLIYGHLDLQPVEGEAWSTPPHRASRRGDRLYARGAADDMGGWVSHLAAIRAWLETTGALPCNVKLVIESEEEIGSPNLERFMDAHPDVFESDVMVLTDCENPSTELPGLTVSLRGLFEVEVICEALHNDVHSGLWGNAAPDVSTALIKLLSRIIDDDGRLAIGRLEVPDAFVEGARRIPLDAEVIRKGARLLPGVEPLPERGRPAAEWMWRQPAVTVLSTTLPRPDQHKNALRARASATLSIRLAPGQTANEMEALLRAALCETPAPGGVRVTLRPQPGGESWLYEPRDPIFDAVNRAYEKAWGHELLQVGVGGTIPFVALFGRRFATLPLVLNGVMDPETNAHGPDESLHLGVFRKAIEANVRLLGELGG